MVKQTCEHWLAHRSTRLGSKLGSAQVGSRLGSARLGLARMALFGARLSSSWLGSWLYSELGLVRLGSWLYSELVLVRLSSGLEFDSGRACKKCWSNDESLLSRSQHMHIASLLESKMFLILLAWEASGTHFFSTRFNQSRLNHFYLSRDQFHQK